MDRAFLALVNLRLKELEKALLTRALALAGGHDDASHSDVANCRQNLDLALAAWRGYLQRERDRNGEERQLPIGRGDRPTDSSGERANRAGIPHEKPAREKPGPDRQSPRR